MDSGEKKKFEPEKKGGDSIDYCIALPSNWGYDGDAITNSSMIHPDISDLSCVSAAMGDSFGPALWTQSSGLKGFGVCHVDARNAASMGWNSPNSMIGGGNLLPNAAGMITQSLSELPTDPAFIERAAKFSCFGGMMNPYGFHGSMDLYSSEGGTTQAQTGIVSVGEASKGTSPCIDRRLYERSPPKGSECLATARDEANQGTAGSSNEPDDREDDTFVLDRNNGDQSAKNPSSKKRKRDCQDKEQEHAKETQKSSEAIYDKSETDVKGKLSVSPTGNKSAGKQGNQGSQASDAPKEEYIHVRARRGQATNSHSLAERVRREKISERMKFLQDLVPGCNKVTGKAVMLDEIINYVQSLQRQVEFLSMKLATVNPRLDLNIEGLLAKDILQPRGLLSSTLPFSPDLHVGLPPVHPSQPILLQPAFPRVDAHSDVLRRTIQSPMTPISAGFEDPARVSGSTWHDELHNLVQTTYETTVPHDI